MAVTKIKKIYATVSKTVEYITDELKTVAKYIADEFKTENNRLVEYYKCGANPLEAAHSFAKTRARGSRQSTVLAHHFMQSFKPGETTPEQAFEIGKKLAERFLKGDYQYVISVHVDKKHIHCHTVFCNTNMFNHKTFITLEDRQKSGWRKLRALSDELCKEHGLSVIETEKISGERGKSYYESQLLPQPSWKSKIKLLLNLTVYEAENFDDFLKKLRAKGVEVVYKPENVIKLKYRLKGQQKFTRARTLGIPYDVDGITERIERYRRFLSGENIYIPRSKAINTATEKMRSAENLQLWARVKNMKTAADILIQLDKMGIRGLRGLDEKIRERRERRAFLIKSEKSLKGEVAELKYLLDTLKVYRAGKTVRDKLLALRAENRKAAAAYERENTQKLTEFAQARQALKAYDFEGNRLPDIKKIENTIEKLTAEADGYSLEARATTNSVGELETMKNTLNDYLGKEHDVERDEQDERAETEPAPGIE